MTQCDNLRVAFAGTPDFAASALQALINSAHTVTCVLTQPDRPAGRGRSLKPSAVKTLALENNLPVLQPENFRSETAVSSLQAYPFDVMVVAAYGLILPESVLTMPELGCLNIHASLLPRWRGAAPIQRALLSGDKQSGVCIMKMDAGLDTGDVIATERIDIDINMTGGELHDQLAELGATSLVASLPGYCRGELTPVPQPADGITYADKLSKAEASLQFSESAMALHRRIQAFNPWPVAEATLESVRYRIRRSRVSGDEVPSGFSPGQVVATDDHGIRVATGDGLLDILEIQKPGKKSMSAADFSRGNQITGKVFD